MTTNFETSYISCGCNKTPHAADWGRNGLICFNSCNSVVIYDPTVAGEGGKIIHTLHGHTERVNCVRWLKNNTNIPEYQLISASADGTACVWSFNEKSNTFIAEVVLKGHTNIVSSADGLVRIPPNTNYIPHQSSLLLVTASIDSTVRVWERNSSSGEVYCIDKIDWKSGFCLDVRFTILPYTDLALLACAADDNNVYLFAEDRKSEIDHIDPEHKFSKIHTLVGHEDWVRAVDFITDENNNLLLATASQDTYIRIFKFSRKKEQKSGSPKFGENSKPYKDLETEETIIAVGSSNKKHTFAVTLETVLAGHEGWVYGVSWHPPVYNTPKGASPGSNMEITGIMRSQKIKLLSSSMDKTMIIWSPKKDGLWSEEARVGEVGGNMLGFYGGKFGPNGKSILGHGYQGSFHIWSLDKESKNWEPKVVVSGHTAEVMDLSWDVKGNYIISVGYDQTTRLHAPWVRNEGKKITWHEIARPQIHGYDMNCLAVLAEHKFASGADEKVIRAFTAPNNFVENYKRICDIKTDAPDQTMVGQPQGAAVPALGLSNKPVFEQLKKEGYIVDDEYPDLYFSPIYLKKPPTEENLMQNTLWPEAQKLYGHGYEIYSLAARKDGNILASSCKATSAEHAAIILWNAKTWLLIQKLISHQLTVTQMSFSPDGTYLLSVSRDRRWSLFGVRSDNKTYELQATSEAKNGFHLRVIWCCSWTFDSQMFATGSRDGKIGVWIPVQKNQEQSKVTVVQLTSLELPKESVTALAFAPVLNETYNILAVGVESGSILLFKLQGSNLIKLSVAFQNHLGHNMTVRRLVFRPKLGRAGVHEESSSNANVLQLASCGADHALKVFDLFLDHL